MWRGRLLGKRLSGLIGLLGPRLGFRDRRLVDGWLRRWRQGPMFLRFEKPVEVREVIANDAVLARAQLDEGNTKVPQPPIAAQCVHAEPESARGNILDRVEQGLGAKSGLTATEMGSELGEIGAERSADADIAPSPLELSLVRIIARLGR